MALRAELDGSRWSHGEERAFPRRRRFVHTERLTVAGEAKDVTFSASSDIQSLRDACDLLNERYGWRGYGSSHHIPSDAHHVTFTAEVDGAVVGTITLGLDSPRGLAIDRTFAEETNRVREAGSQICELTKFAIHPGIRSKPLLAKLFHMVFIYGTSVSDCTDLFIEVNPRHVLFYEAMLGFDRVGSLVTNLSVGAPSQLMQLRVDAIRRNILELAGRGDAAEHRSLYPHFFPATQEAEIRRGLVSAGDGEESPARRLQRSLAAATADLQAAAPQSVAAAAAAVAAPRGMGRSAGIPRAA
jgi:hypothetical protein